MSRTKGTRGPADAQRCISITAWPWTGSTDVVVAVGWRDAAGPHRSTLARWSLRLTRADLAGHSTDDVLRALLERVLHRLESGADPADHVKAVGTGAPLGATGGTVTTEHPADAPTDSPRLPGL